MNTTKMVHPDHQDRGVVTCNLNEWGRYRAAGWQSITNLRGFNEVDYNAEAKLLRGEVEESAQSAEEVAAHERKTEPKSDDGKTTKKDK